MQIRPLIGMLQRLGNRYRQHVAQVRQQIIVRRIGNAAMKIQVRLQQCFRRRRRFHALVGFADGGNVGIGRMLGGEGSFGQEDLGLATDFAVNVIASVGNYGEIYDRYMGPEGLSFTLDRGLNALWSDGGLIYGIPLR